MSPEGQAAAAVAAAAGAVGTMAGPLFVASVHARLRLAAVEARKELAGDGAWRQRQSLDIVGCVHLHTSFFI